MNHLFHQISNRFVVRNLKYENDVNVPAHQSFKCTPLNLKLITSTVLATNVFINTAVKLWKQLSIMFGFSWVCSTLRLFWNRYDISNRDNNKQNNFSGKSPEFKKTAIVAHKRAENAENKTISNDWTRHQTVE